MNKKGFSLVELLAVLALIGLVLGISVISYTAFVARTRERVFKNYENTMKAAAEVYFIDNPQEIPSINGVKKELLLEDLEIDPIINPDDSNDLCLNSKVIVERSDNIGNNFDLKYSVCLKCNNYQSNACNN